MNVRNSKEVILLKDISVKKAPLKTGQDVVVLSVVFYQKGTITKNFVNYYFV